MSFDSTNGVQNWLEELSSESVHIYLTNHETEDDAHRIALKNKPIFGVPSRIIASQIIARIKAKVKLPQFYAQSGVVFPEAINLEQCSSEITAGFKVKFLKDATSDRNLMVDLTGGFGVDSKFFCRLFDQVDSIDPDKKLNEIVRWNFKLFNILNFRRVDLTSEIFLQRNTQPVSCFYADPSRRSPNQKKVVSMRDCLPDIISLQEMLFRQSRFLLLKAAPLLDITLALSELNYVRKVIVLSVANECKEVLFFCDRDYSSAPVIGALNLKREIIEEFYFTQAEEAAATATLGGLGQYLYEPNSSILKAGAFKLVCDRFQLLKLSKNSHFYTGNEFCAEFPGRIFEVIKTVKSNSEEIAVDFPGRKANIISRNYPLSVAELMKKLKLVEGGDKFLIATSTEEKKILIVCNRKK
jgi:hypothetical protein